MKNTKRMTYRLVVSVAAAAATARLWKRSPGGGYRTSLPWRAFNNVMIWIDRRIGWHKVPRPLGFLVILGVQNVLRQRSLYDTTEQPAVNVPPVGTFEPSYLVGRTVDGTYNDLDDPAMGMAGSRFGR